MAIDLSALHLLAARQHGLFTQSQFVELGGPRQTLANWHRSGRVIKLAPRTYGVGGGTPSWRQHVMAACLSTGGVASHRTAAALLQLDGFKPGIIEVVLPRWMRRPATVTVHESLDLIERDTTKIDGIPCTSLIRTVVDLPAVAGLERSGFALDHACRLDHRNLTAIKYRFLEVARRGRNGTAKMRVLLAERTGESFGPDSPFEAKFLQLVRGAGLPEPELQYEVRFDDGTKAYLDAAWPDEMVLAECDSLAYHFGKHMHQKDRTRRRKLVLLGWSPLEFTYEDVTQRGALVLRQLARALGLDS